MQTIGLWSNATGGRHCKEIAPPGGDGAERKNARNPKPNCTRPRASLAWGKEETPQRNGAAVASRDPWVARQRTHKQMAATASRQKSALVLGVHYVAEVP